MCIRDRIQSHRERGQSVGQDTVRGRDQHDFYFSFSDDLFRLLNKTGGPLYIFPEYRSIDIFSGMPLDQVSVVSQIYSVALLLSENTFRGGSYADPGIPERKLI